MKFITFGLVILAFTQIAQSKFNHEEFKERAEKCRKVSGWTGDFKSEEETKERKCFYECMAKEEGVMTADGKMDKDKALEMGKAMFADEPEKMAVYNKITEECFSEVKPADEPCETAYLFFKCYRSKGEGFKKE